MAVTLPRGGEAALDEVEVLSRSGLAAQDLLEQAAALVERIVPSMGRFYAAADPDTGLCMGAGLAEQMPSEVCVPFWEHEFQVPDYNKFADLGTAAQPVADLHQVTGGRPERSPRWRTFHAEFDWDAELRAAFTAGGATWGVAQLSRATGDRPFSEEEVAFVAAVARPIAQGLRHSLVALPAVNGGDRGPGMAIIDGAGRMLSMTDEAAAWLDELLEGQSAAIRENLLPIELASLAASARGGVAARRVRARTRTGVWLLAHASMLSGTDGHVALVIEPAKASEVAPLIIEAYGLTPRELEVTRMIARGKKTSEIAAQLYLSPHTVRDHVKAIFEKVGVRSRGELVATMFADHYHDNLDEAIEDSYVRLGTG